MTKNSVELTLRADTSAFSTSIRQAEQEFSSRFRHMGSTAQTQSKRIKGNFNSISDGAEKFSTKSKQAESQLTLMAGAATGIGLLGKRMLDTADSVAIKQTHFNKLRTVLSGQGWVPAGLDGLDYSIPLLLKCAAPRSVSSTNTQFTIPANRRNDSGFEPKSFAVVSGNLTETEITLNADIVNLDTVTGALTYQIYYYPEILVFAESPQVQGNMTGAEFSWTLTCEEVNVEIVKVLAINGTQLEIERAQENTVAISWHAGALIEARVTVGALKGLKFDVATILTASGEILVSPNGNIMISSLKG
jgi:hypothetical protein